MNKLLSAALALPLFVSAPTALVALPTPAIAAPVQVVCTIWTYYSDREKTDIVGTKTFCPGSGTQRQGRTTRYYTIERESLGPVGGGGHHAGGSGGLPCEFLAKGCSNLPQPRPYY